VSSTTVYYDSSSCTARLSTFSDWTIAHVGGVTIGQRSSARAPHSCPGREPAF
jgi:hypothetical protein